MQEKAQKSLASITSVKDMENGDVPSLNKNESMNFGQDTLE